MVRKVGDPQAAVQADQFKDPLMAFVDRVPHTGLPHW